MNKVFKSKESEIEDAKRTQKLLKKLGVNRKLEDLPHPAKVDEVVMRH